MIPHLLSFPTFHMMGPIGAIPQYVPFIVVGVNAAVPFILHLIEIIITMIE
jgi:hypothetical protein